MFLFNVVEVLSFVELECLNTASVLIQRHARRNGESHRAFKYSICSYSTVPCAIISTVRKFKYSICSYSTFLPAPALPLRSGLNTASVLIQREDKRLEDLSDAFKYSICSYSTLYNQTLAFQVI